MFSSLARIFITERHRQRAGHVGFSLPAMSEVELESEAEPFLATNMRRSFLRTRLSRDNQARFGFSECPITEEDSLVSALFRAIAQCSAYEKWSNRASSVEEGLALMRTLGLEPKNVVLPKSTQLAIDGITMLPSHLPAGSALITAAPQHTGSYTRVGDHLGILAQRVDRAFVVVE